MRTQKNGDVILGAAEYDVMIEALRRRGRFGRIDGRWQAITAQWTGLGTPTAYKDAVKYGLMERSKNPVSRGMDWWTLTEKGARIVAYWIGQGYSYESVEANRYPEITIPASIL